MKIGNLLQRLVHRDQATAEAPPHEPESAAPCEPDRAATSSGDRTRDDAKQQADVDLIEARMRRLRRA